MVKPPGYNSEEEDAAPAGNRQTGRSPRPQSGTQPSPSISRQRSASGAATAASPTIGSDLPSPTDRVTRRRSASGRSGRAGEGAGQQASSQQRTGDWLQGGQPGGRLDIRSARAEGVAAAEAGAAQGSDVDEDALVELKAQYMEQQQSLRTQQEALQQEQADKEAAAMQLECQLQERQQQQEHYQVMAGPGWWCNCPCCPALPCPVLLQLGRYRGSTQKGM